MRIFRILLSALMLAVCVSGCEESLEPPVKPKPGQTNNKDDDKPEDKPEDKPNTPDKPNGWNAKDGVDYIYDGTTVPQMHIKLSVEEWNKLLKAYDKDPNTKKQVVCSIRFDKGGEITEIDQVTIRLKGNTSRRRPEGNNGSEHVKDNKHWRHCHFQLNFHKLVKDGAHELHGARKMVLKWFKEDPSYVRELYCYDLFRRSGVWTGAHSAYCQLYLHIEGDAEEAYFGIYNMIEPIDDEFLKARKEELGGEKDGFLWKCRYGCSLADANADFGADLGDGREHTYELKTWTEEEEIAKEQIKDFILKFNGKSGDSFKTWISQVCDVQLLLRTYAVNVCVGMWDDYWNNMNNFYIYFSTRDKLNYKFYFIPYDYDNTLGTSSSCGNQDDSGRQDPFNWGNKNNPLIYKLLQVPEFRKIYKNELLRLVDPMKEYFTYEASSKRIRQWQDSIRGKTANDTGEDMEIKDQPASWGNHSEYRLLDKNNNFFIIKAESVNKYCKKE